MAVTLVDITSGQLQKVLAYLEAEAHYLATPPELRSIFPPNFAFDFSRIRVSVQLSQERLRYAEARQRERERAAGVWPDADQQRSARRSAEEYAAQAQQAVVQDWEQVRGDLHTSQWLRRAIILGDPGFGKSWLLRYEGHALARAEIARLQRSEAGTASVVLPIFARLGELAKKKGSLLDRLRAVLKKPERGAPHVGMLWDLIAAKAMNGQALLLLDGWDEVRQGRAPLQEALETFVRTNPECRIYLTSRIAGYVPLNLSAREWELVAFSPKQIQVFVQNFFSMPASLQDEPQGDRESRATRGAALWRALRQRPQVMGLARIPLMLALLCRLAWEGQALPDLRVEVYQQCLEGLLWRWRKAVGDDTILATDPIEEKLRLLPVLAFALLQTSPHVDVWPWLDLRTRLQQLPGGPPDRKKAAALLAELVRDGILVREGAGDRAPYRFLHLTFQEYLAASALAQRPDWCQIVTRWLEGFWEPRAPVIELLAGMLPDATPLIELLLAYDDPRPLHTIAHQRLLQPQRAPNPFGTVLLLAARCGAETRRITRSSVQEICGRAEQGLKDEFQRDTAAQALAWLGRQWREPFAYLLTALHDGEPEVHRAAAKALGQLGDTRAVPSLLTVLHDENEASWLRKLVAQALGQLGDKSAVPALMTVLHDKEPGVRRAATEALGQLGDESAVPALLTMLHDENEITWFRELAAQALGQLGDESAVPALLTMLHDENSEVCQTAVKVFADAEEAERLGQRIYQHTVPRLLTTQHDRSRLEVPLLCLYVKRLGQLGDARAVPPLLTALHDEASGVRMAAVEALAQLGDARAVPPLLTALHDKNDGAHGMAVARICQAAARALEQIERRIWEEKDRLP